MTKKSTIFGGSIIIFVMLIISIIFLAVVLTFIFVEKEPSPPPLQPYETFSLLVGLGLCLGFTFHGFALVDARHETKITIIEKVKRK